VGKIENDLDLRLFISWNHLVKVILRFLRWRIVHDWIESYLQVALRQYKMKASRFVIYGGMHVSYQINSADVSASSHCLTVRVEKSMPDDGFFQINTESFESRIYTDRH
jgi:hypothetical protein